MNAQHMILLGTALLAAPACVSGEGDLDVEDDVDATIDGKADGISAQAGAILSLVNDPRISREQLDDDAGLSNRVATDIIALRDAELIDDLAELDAIPYVGPRTLEKLAAYAVEVIPPATTARTFPVAITADTTWSPSMGPLSLQSFHVPADVTLTITPGTTVYVKNGPLFVGGNLVVQGVRAAPVALVGDGPELTAWSGIDVLAGGTLTLDHAVITDASSGVSTRSGAAETRLTNLTIERFGFQGIAAGPNTTIDVDGFVATHSGALGDAVRVAAGADVTVRNAVVSIAHSPFDNSGTLLVEGATFVNNRFTYGFGWNSSPQTTVRNAIFAGGLVGELAGTLELERVLLWNTENEQHLPAGADVLHGDPAFVSATDYHLTPGSPAIDAGSGGAGHDLAGNPRVGAPDLGAYELVR